MAELFANTFEEPLGELTNSVTENGLKFKLTAIKMPPELLLAGEFRILIDNELCMVEGWLSPELTIKTRGIESTTKITHAAKAKIYHKLTAGALTSLRTNIEAEAKKVAEAESSKIKSAPVLVTTSPYVLKLSDVGKTIEVEINSGGEATIEVPKLIFEVGHEGYICQTGTEKVKVVAQASVEIKVPGGLHPKTDARWSTLAWRKRGGTGPEQFVVAGDLEI